MDTLVKTAFWMGLTSRVKVADAEITKEALSEEAKARAAAEAERRVARLGQVADDLYRYGKDPGPVERAIQRRLGQLDRFEGAPPYPRHDYRPMPAGEARALEHMHGIVTTPLPVKKAPVLPISKSMGRGAKAAIIGGGLLTAAGLGLGAHHLWKRHQQEQEKNSAAPEVLKFLRDHPNAARAAGAAALAIPATLGGYLYEKRRHTPGAGGKSKFELESEADLAKHRGEVAYGGEPTKLQTLRGKYYDIKDQIAQEAAQDPKRAARIAALWYGATLGGIGASALPRILRATRP